MKRSTLQKQHATALRGARSCFLEGAPFLRYTLITKLAGEGKLLRFASRNHFPEGAIFFYPNLAG